MSDENEDWAEVCVEACCEILDWKRVPVNGEDRDKRIGEVPYYGANGLQGYIDTFIFDEPLILIAEDGGRFDEYSTRPIAYRISGKSWVNNHAHVLKANDAFCQDAIFYNLEHKDIQSFIVGGTRSKLNQSALRAITLSLPKSKPEQTKIAEILSTVDRALEQTDALIAKQQRIKTGLMQDLLTRGIDANGNLRTEQTHEFKDSPLGRIPVEWDVLHLKDVSIGGAQNGFFKKPELVGFGCKLINVSEIYQDFGIDTNNRKVERVDVTPKNLKKYGVTNGDVFFTRSSLVLEGIAHCNIINKVYEPTVFECHVMRIRPNLSKIEPSFLALYCQSHLARIFLMSRAKHVTMTTISQPELESLHVPVPRSMNEQKLILNAIQAVESTLRQNQNDKAKLKNLKTSLMQDLLTGRKRVTALLAPIAM